MSDRTFHTRDLRDEATENLHTCQKRMMTRIQVSQEPFDMNARRSFLMHTFRSAPLLLPYHVSTNSAVSQHTATAQHSSFGGFTAMQKCLDRTERDRNEASLERESKRPGGDRQALSEL